MPRAPSAARMLPGTSCYLDLLRIGAALIVFGGHCMQFWAPETASFLFGQGHHAVIVFFVLSGYVVAHSTWSKNLDWKNYALARLSRLSSVILPGLALTALLWMVGRQLNPDFYASLSRGHDLLRLAISAFFLQEIGPFSASPPTNAPLWSLGYEFWYYALFGCVFLLKPGKARWLSAAVLLLIGGLKIAMLLPVWLLGAGLYRFAPAFRCACPVARLGFVLTTGLLGIALVRLPDWPTVSGYAPLFYSGSFLTDWIVGAGVAASIWCFHHGWGGITPPAAVRLRMRRTADHTFSLYVYHYPLIVFATAVVPFDHHSGVQTLGMAAFLLILIAGLGELTEAKRESWRGMFTQLWTILARHPASSKTTSA